MMRSNILAFSLLSTLPFAAAHGYVHAISIDGQRYEGNAPNSNKVESPIRTISTINPVKGADNKAINCGPSAEPAAVVADASPGSTLEFDWGDWPHNTGPILTYLASCGDSTCDQFDASDAQWFKIDQAGKKSGSSEWYQQDIMNGQSYSTKLPNNLASGQYLVRHEIIGLHLAQSSGGAEFYPSCSQINVVGDGTATPSSDELVSFPGAYSDNDPGILVNAFNNDDYDFPGPQIATLSGNGGSDSSSGGTSASNSGSSRSSTPESTSSSNARPTRTRGAVNAATSPADAPSPTSAAPESTSTATRKRKPCRKVTTESADPAQASESVLTSFAVTRTISLRSLPTDADTYYGPSPDLPDVRPHRVSRVMRSLLKHH
ncbi:hypothetical protein ACEPAH_6105 [Sanghuangporus vaninii]